MRYLLLLSGLLAVACGSQAAATPAAPVLAAIRAISAPDRIHALNDAAHRHQGESAALATLLSDPEPRVRWAAAYVAALWANDEDDVAALAPHLNDPDDGTRAVIAGSLAGLGHAGARQTLSALATSSAPMPFSDPAMTVGRFAADAIAAIDRAGVAKP